MKRFGDHTPPVEPILAINTKDLHEREGVLRDLLVDAWLAVAFSDLVERFDG